MTYIIFARKYRPKTFDEMIGQKTVVQTLKNAIKNDRVAQAYLFSGMRGVGKTTAARILAKALNCQHGPAPTPCNKCESCRAINEDRSVDVLEIDGASNRGIDEVRSLREGVKYKPLHSRNKIIIIDEVHMLTREAFNALLKTLEEPPEHTIFIFATTEFHKVPATIVSRCQQFEFKKISQKDIINHLLDITQKEKISITSYGVNLIAEAAEGSLRDAQSLLDQAVSFCGDVISDEDLREILGTIDRELLSAFSSVIIEGKPDQIFPLVEKLIEMGFDLRYFYKKLIEHFRNLLLVKSTKKPQEIIPLNEDEIDVFRKEASGVTSEEILRYLSLLQQGEQGLKFSSHPQIYLETLLVRLCQLKKLVPTEEILRELKELKKEIVSSSKSNHSDVEVVPGVKEDKRIEKSNLPVKKKEDREIVEKLMKVLVEKKGSLAAILSQNISFKIKQEEQEKDKLSGKERMQENLRILELSVPGGDRFYLDTLKKEMRFLEKVASDVLGEKVKVRLSEDSAGIEKPREKEVEAALKDPSIRYFMDLFKAQVISVEPVKRVKNRG